MLFLSLTLDVSGTGNSWLMVSHSWQEVKGTSLPDDLLTLHISGLGMSLSLWRSCHKGWTSNKEAHIHGIVFLHYQSHKEWTSNFRQLWTEPISWKYIPISWKWNTCKSSMRHLWNETIRLKKFFLITSHIRVWKHLSFSSQTSDWNPKGIMAPMLKDYKFCIYGTLPFFAAPNSSNSIEMLSSDC